MTAIIVTSLLASSGCVTTTAHRLVLADNPLREQAIACEAKCRLLGAPSRQPCGPAFGGDACTEVRGNADDYAACLDNCPGARAKDGSSCPEPPVADVICVETTKANAGGIAGTIFVAVGIGLAILAIGLIYVFLGIFAGIGG